MKKVAMFFAGAVLLCSCQFIKVDSKLAQNLLHDAEASRIISDDDMFAKLSSKTVPVTDFNSLIVDGAYEIKYTPGPSSIVVNAPAKVMEHLAVTQTGSLVHIYTDGKRMRWKNVEVLVSSPSLEALTVNGAVDFEADRGLSGADFTMEVNGAGDIELNGLMAERVTITMNGAGDIEVERLQCEHLSLNVNGAGDVEIEGRSTTADVSVSGAGDINLYRLDCPGVVTRTRGLGSIKTSPRNR